MQDFAYRAPETLQDAVAALAAEGARPLAGGTDLIPQMREQRRTVAAVVDLKKIPALMSIATTPDGGLEIGAAVSCTTIARHPRVREAYPGLAAAAGLVGSLQIQSRASLGGNLCNASPSADTTPILIALQAQAKIANSDGLRLVHVADVLAGPGRTSLARGEIVSAILLPPPTARSAAIYHRFTPRREMDIAVAGVASSLALDGQGRITVARIVLAAVGPVPIDALEAATTLLGHKPSPQLFAAAAGLAAASARPISDARGSADYRRTLVEVLTARTLAACAAELGIQVEVA